MSQYLSAEEVSFRDEVRAFIKVNLPPELATKARRQSHIAKADVVAWHKILYKRGWSAPSWPTEYGGTGWTPAQRFIFEDECAAADAPPLSFFGVSMIGPVLYTFGTEAQKARYLPGIVSMDTHWCQGYSEPGAGSDLASLRTRADSDGDVYVVNGSKIWTSDAHKADMMFCLVRTDPEAKQQRGISFLLIDMKSPGLTVSPLISIDGGHTLNEVFFDNVRVPKENLVGEEHKGWTYAKFLLGHERVMSAEVARSKRRLAMLKTIARIEQANGAPLIEDPHFASRLAAVEIEMMALDLTNHRLLVRGEATDAMAAASMMKLRGSEVMQKLTELTVDALGFVGLPYAAADDGSHQSTGAPAYADGRVEDYLFRRAATIYAGSSETQRNILAKSIFGH
ncbi:MAG: pimeloyl-CoA dehydrogenase large subunit [Variovorax sp.]|nr:pimeloyl-CoA dehydrogenase large subunit [Variovorax sp.]